jgi:hypothetical protein
MKATVEVTPAYVILHFPKGATITKELYYRLQSEFFWKMGAKGSNDYVATPHASERDLCERIAHLIAADFNAGRYRERLQPKRKIQHG